MYENPAAYKAEETYNDAVSPEQEAELIEAGLSCCHYS
jgi:hypothetical protein